MVKPVLQSRTAARLAQARLLVAQGHSRREVSRQLQEEFGIHRNSALRTLRLLEAEQIAELDSKRRRLVARQHAKLELVIRRAYGEDGQPAKLAVVVRAIAEQNRLLGLHGDHHHTAEDDAGGVLILVPRPVGQPAVEARGSAPAAPAGEERWPYTPRYTDDGSRQRGEQSR